MCIIRQQALTYIEDRDKLAINNSGTWSKPLLLDKELALAIRLHLWSTGKYVTARDVVDYLRDPQIRKDYGLKYMIQGQTARRWMSLLGYKRSRSTRRGMLINGHKSDNALAY